MYPKNEENDVFHVVAMVIKMATLDFLKPDGLLNRLIFGTKLYHENDFLTIRNSTIKFSWI